MRRFESAPRLQDFQHIAPAINNLGPQARFTEDLSISLKFILRPDRLQFGFPAGRTSMMRVARISIALSLSSSFE
jgi:hypothetical protein